MLPKCFSSVTCVPFLGRSRCTGCALQPLLDPGQPLGVEGMTGAGDGDVGQHGVGAGYFGRLAVWLRRGSGKSPAMRTVGHSRPLALWAVDTTVSAASSGLSRSMKSITTSGP